MSVVVRLKGRNCEAGRARRRFCPSGVQVIFEWRGGVRWTPIAAHGAVSSSINASSGSSINGDSNFAAFCDHLHEGLELTRGGQM